MGNQVTITAKIPAELKKKLTKLEINVSGLVREALQSEVERIEKEKLRSLAAEAGEILQKIPAEEIIDAIRAGRENR